MFLFSFVFFELKFNSDEYLLIADCCVTVELLTGCCGRKRHYSFLPERSGGKWGDSKIETGSKEAG
jgi:hypothetical protein